MRKRFPTRVGLLLIVIAMVVVGGLTWQTKASAQTVQTDAATVSAQTGDEDAMESTADHSQFEELQKEFPPGSGKMWEPLDLANIAQNVGQPDRDNCGTCHFSGGGGDGVKHGDLDSSLFHPDKSLDVHMDEEGLNFSCTDCHLTSGR